VFVAGTTDDFKRYLFHNAEPAVVDAAGRRHAPNPCGYLPSAFPPGIAIDLLRLHEIRVPVLLALGDHDPVFSPGLWALQERHFSGSRDVTTHLLRSTGHFPMLERTAPQLRATVSEWLTARGLVRAPVRAARTQRRSALVHGLSRNEIDLSAGAGANGDSRPGDLLPTVSRRAIG
jgi:hypothetical protein